MKLAICILLFAGSLAAQTVTRSLTLTLDAANVPAIKNWIAQIDGNVATVDERNITNAAALTFIQAEIDQLVKKLQRTALQRAAAEGRTDLLPAAITAELTKQQEAEAARATLEAAGAGVN